MKYAIVEAIRKLAQIFAGNEICDFPVLYQLRVLIYRLLFSIGKNPTIGNGVRLTRSHKMADGKVKIGENVLLAKHLMIDYSGEVIIGSNVWLSEYSQIHTHKHLLLKNRVTNGKETIVPTKLEIQDGAWIGANAVILPSVSVIGEGAIIGAAAVVTKNVEPYTVVAGNPAKVIKEKINETWEQ
ncbi:MAG: acyltransferase [Clostridiales bacterium]|nr:acyltransferase [Clostridiales bacterium]